MMEPPIAAIFTMRCSPARRAAHGLGSPTARCHHDERYDKLTLALRGLSPLGQLRQAEEVNLCAAGSNPSPAPATAWARWHRSSGDSALDDAVWSPKSPRERAAEIACRRPYSMTLNIRRSPALRDSLSLWCYFRWRGQMPAARAVASRVTAPALQERTGFRSEKEHVCGRPHALRRCGRTLRPDNRCDPGLASVRGRDWPALETRRVNMSIKINDTQLVLLSAASQRDDHCLVPPTGPKLGQVQKGHSQAS